MYTHGLCSLVCLTMLRCVRRTGSRTLPNTVHDPISMGDGVGHGLLFQTECTIDAWRPRTVIGNTSRATGVHRALPTRILIRRHARIPTTRDNSRKAHRISKRSVRQFLGLLGKWKTNGISICRRGIQNDRENFFPAPECPLQRRRIGRRVGRRGKIGLVCSRGRRVIGDNLRPGGERFIGVEK